jgi:hypothetical protein
MEERRDTMAVRKTRIIAITILLLFCVLAISNCRLNREYRLPGFIQIQLYPYTIEEAQSIQDELLAIGYDPIIGGHFDYEIANQDNTKKTLFTISTVTENYPQYLWKDIVVDIEGRNLAENDIYDRKKVCVIGNYIMSTVFGEEMIPANALGRKITIEGEDFEIIGVVEYGGDLSNYPVDSIYIPLTTAVDMGEDGVDYIQTWIDEGSDLQAQAKRIYDYLIAKGYDVSVQFICEEASGFYERK